jgi:hypothetical protein
MSAEGTRFLAELKSADAWRRIAAIERIGALALDDAEVGDALLDALDDRGVYEYEERDWDAEDEWPPRTRTVVKRVAESTVNVLRSDRRRGAAVRAIAARIASRDPERAKPLFEALGALAPDSTEPLLRALAGEHEANRAAAVRALGKAVFSSRPLQKLEVLRRAIEGLEDRALEGEWRKLLEYKHALFATPGQDALRDAVRAEGPDVGTLERWLASEERSVRAIAISMLACLAGDARARALLAARIVEELPRVSGTYRNVHGFRDCEEIELALLILCHEEALASVCAEDPRAPGVVRDHVVRGLGEPGEPWFVVLALARALTHEPAITRTILRHLEAPGAASIPELATLLIAHARAASIARAELVRRGALALLSHVQTHRPKNELRALAALDGATFTGAVLPLLENAQPYDTVTWVIAEGLQAAGPGGVAALPALERLVAKTLGWTPMKSAIDALAKHR